MSDKPEDIYNVLLVAAGRMADKLFVYGEAFIETSDPEGPFGLVEINGIPTRITLFGQEDEPGDRTPNLLTKYYGGPAGGSMKD